MRRNIIVITFSLITSFLLANCSRQNSTDHLNQSATYYFGLIKTGNQANSFTEEELQEIQKAHLANIVRLAEEGKLILAGPFWRENSDNIYRGIFIYTVATLEEAETLVQTDPAVQAGRLRVELYPWLGSKTLHYDKNGEMRAFQAAIFWHASEKSDINFDDLYELQSETISTLSDTARIVLAGPFQGKPSDGSPHSFFVYSVDNVYQIDKIAKQIYDKYPKQLNATVLDWYGPVGLAE